MEPIAYLFLYKAMTYAIGLVFLFLGFNLIKTGFKEKSSLTISFSKLGSMSLNQASPGLIFSALGAIIIFIGIYKGFNYKSQLQPTATYPIEQVDTSPTDQASEIVENHEPQVHTIDVMPRVEQSEKIEIVGSSPSGYMTEEHIAGDTLIPPEAISSGEQYQIIELQGVEAPPSSKGDTTDN